jgi:iron complex transport system ATP-binding protein
VIYQVTGAAFRYRGSRADALVEVDLAVAEGSFYGILGPNGCGKTTLLRILLGALEPGRGAVAYRGRPVGAWPRRELARRVGVVPQLEPLVFPITVRELVAMGRYPHLGSWRSEGPGDREAVRRAMATCDIAGLEDRPVSTLSGGEQQRARLARALAQEPETLVLDEPTASLDIAHEMEIFELLRALSGRGVTVIVVTHNLNIAARYADRLLLLDRGRPAAEGGAAQVFTRETLERVYRWPLMVGAHTAGDDAGAPQIVPLRRPDPEPNPVDR